MSAFGTNSYSSITYFLGGNGFVRLKITCDTDRSDKTLHVYSDVFLHLTATELQLPILQFFVIPLSLRIKFDTFAIPTLNNMNLIVVYVHVFQGSAGLHPGFWFICGGISLIIRGYGPDSGDGIVILATLSPICSTISNLLISITVP